MELQEIEIFQVNANPLKKNVHLPKLGKRVARKPSTKVKPFNLMEFKKQEMPKDGSKFTARSIPKGLFERPHGIPEKSVKTTVPNSPAITKAQEEPLNF